MPEPKVTNPGTSWVGDGRLLIVAARLQSEVIRWLHRYEFVDFDRCCAGMTGWSVQLTCKLPHLISMRDVGNTTTALLFFYQTLGVIYARAGALLYGCRRAAQYRWPVVYLSAPTSRPNWHYKVLTLYAGYIAFNTLGDGLKRIVMEVHEGTAGKGTWRGDNMMLEPIRHAHVLHGRGVFSKHDLADGVYDTVHLKHLDPRLLPEYCLLVVVQSIRMPSTVLKELVAAPKLLDTSR